MATKLMSRIFSAIDNKEDDLVTQFQDDLELTRAQKELNTEEYSMYTQPDGSIVVHDKINDEDTKITEIDDNYQMEPVMQNPYAINKGDEVHWLDANGNLMKGTLDHFDGPYAHIINDLGNEVVVDAALLAKTTDKEFAAASFNMIANIDGHDCQIDTNKGILTIPEEKVSFKFDPKVSFTKVIALISAKLASSIKPKRSFSTKGGSKSFSRK